MALSASSSSSKSLIRNGFHKATILAKQMVSPTVCLLDLHINDGQTLKSFLPGQWVDFVNQDTQTPSWVGGFSLASIPEELPHCRLAIKQSLHAPSQWVHSDHCRVDDQVLIRVGGTCVLDWKKEERPKSIVFVAGGIGISPIFSMYHSLLLHRKQQHASSSSSIIEDTTPVHFLYSVSHTNELVFGTDILQLANQYGNPDIDSLVFTLTQQDSWEGSSMTLANSNNNNNKNNWVDFRIGRQMTNFLDSHCGCDTTKHETPYFYLCGPPAMMEAASANLLQKNDVQPSHIRYEKWW